MGKLNIGSLVENTMILRTEVNGTQGRVKRKRNSLLINLLRVY